jgi:hypothetical protein
MIRFYLNRELSAMLGIRLSRWKRWSREFLPPDPLGGLQSGFARQYSLQEAFQVYLGGHMVADLKISIPEAVTILGDLKEWVTTRYFSYRPPEEQSLVRQTVKEYRIYIFMNLEPTKTVQTHAYMVHRMIDQERSHGKGARIVTERYIENWLTEGETVDESDRPDDFSHWMTARILYITKVYQTFTECLQREVE